MSTTVNYPEMWGASENPIQAEYSAILGKYRVTSKSELKLSRGVTFDKVVDKEGANGVQNKRAGWFRYHVTERAFQKLEKENNVVLNCLLD